MNPWLNDPKLTNPNASVSLTILAISVINLVAMNIMQVLHKVDTIGISMEFFSVASALYFSRRINFGSKSLVTNIETKEGNNEQA